MYCPSCLKFVNAVDPDFCPHCGANLKKKKRRPGKLQKVLGITIGIIGVLIFLISIPDTEPQLVSSNQETVALASSGNTFGIGDTAELNNVRVTLNSVTESFGSDFMRPSDGNVFVICEFTIENNTSSDIAVSSMMSFTAYFDEYAANLSLSAMTMDDGKQQLDGTVAPGKKIRGVVGYEAPSNWSDLEIHFISSLYSSTPFIFNCRK